MNAQDFGNFRSICSSLPSAPSDLDLLELYACARALVYLPVRVYLPACERMCESEAAREGASSEHLRRNADLEVILNYGTQKTWLSPTFWRTFLSFVKVDYTLNPRHFEESQMRVGGLAMTMYRIERLQISRGEKGLLMRLIELALLSTGTWMLTPLVYEDLLDNRNLKRYREPRQRFPDRDRRAFIAKGLGHMWIYPAVPGTVMTFEAQTRVCKLPHYPSASHAMVLDTEGPIEFDWKNVKLYFEALQEQDAELWPNRTFFHEPNDIFHDKEVEALVSLVKG